ncbi:MAG: alpha/beta hydrolase [Peptostreptococcaceae bacterium]|nr:alpha/beta hydrolase [Peptostreptococcaceae bacterium]
MSAPSLKYRMLKKLIKAFGVKKFFQKDQEVIVERMRKEMYKVKIPRFSDTRVKYEVREFCGEKVIYITHKKPVKEVCLFLIGGGMLRHPTPDAIKGALKIALASGRDMVIPYYPLCIDHTIDEVYDWLYRLYRSILESYDISDMMITGSSSGGALALGLVSHINALGREVPLPKKIYCSSPGNCFRDRRSIEQGYELNRKDILLDMAYFEIYDKIMTHGRSVPEYMLFLETGNYQGLEEVYLSYGSDEVLYAACDKIKNRLQEQGVNVILEVGEGLFHCYPFFPIVKETQDGWDKMVKYHSKR